MEKFRLDSNKIFLKEFNITNTYNGVRSEAKEGLWKKKSVKNCRSTRFTKVRKSVQDKIHKANVTIGFSPKFLRSVGRSVGRSVSSHDSQSIDRSFNIQLVPAVCRPFTLSHELTKSLNWTDNIIQSAAYRNTRLFLLNCILRM